MMGDLTDMLSRLRVVLPKRWFSEQSPVLAALLQAILQAKAIWTNEAEIS